MVSYKYTAMSDTGETVEGMIEAFDELDAAERIRKQYKVVVSMQEASKTSMQLELPSFLYMDIGGRKIKPKAFTLMCSQFATILGAGIPVARAVQLICEKTGDKVLKNLLLAVAEDVEAGRTISASFEEHGGKLLPPTFVETLRAGEEAGDIASSFDSIYRHYDKQTKMAGKVRSAMMYPIFVLCVAVIVVIVLMVKVVPAFTEVFDAQGAQLPLITRILIGMSGFVSQTFWYFLIILLVLAIGLILFERTDKGKIAMAKVQLALPIVGNIAELNTASLFANTMASMVGSGIPMMKAVSVTADVFPNEWIRQKSMEMVAKIEEGRNVADSMREAECFPDILTDMVGVGEETGEMKETLDTIARYYDEELETAVTSAVAMLEPALLVFIAIVAGFIVVAIYMSMFAMYSVM